MKKGFTLLELIVVMAIIGTLIGIGISSYTSSLKKARDAKRKADLHQIQVALEEFKQASPDGKYPQTTGWVNSLNKVPGRDWWIPSLDANYIKLMPIDPTNIGGVAPDQPNTYNYAYYSANGLCGYSAGDYYVLATRLENPADHDGDAGQTILINNCGWPTNRIQGIYALSNP